MMEHNSAIENIKRVEHTYEVGDKITYTKHGKQRKLVTPRSGPFEITHVYTNDTVHIQRGKIHERVNIRHLTPFLDEP